LTGKLIDIRRPGKQACVGAAEAGPAYIVRQHDHNVGLLLGPQLGDKKTGEYE